SPQSAGIVQEPTLPITPPPVQRTVPETRVIHSPAPPPAPERTTLPGPPPPKPRVPSPAVKPPVAGQPPRQVAARKRSVATFVSIGVVLLVLGAGGYVVWWYVAGRSRPQPAATPVQAPPATTSTPPVVEPPKGPPAPQGMVTVEAGSYTIGRNAGDQ